MYILTWTHKFQALISIFCQLLLQDPILWLKWESCYFLASSPTPSCIIGLWLWYNHSNCKCKTCFPFIFKSAVLHFYSKMFWTFFHSLWISSSKPFFCSGFSLLPPCIKVLPLILKLNDFDKSLLGVDYKISAEVRILNCSVTVFSSFYKTVRTVGNASLHRGADSPLDLLAQEALPFRHPEWPCFCLHL